MALDPKTLAEGGYFREGGYFIQTNPHTESTSYWSLGEVLAKHTRATDEVMFDWPKIEKVATDSTSPMHALCRILVEARAVGRRSASPGPWP